MGDKTLSNPTSFSSSSSFRRRAYTSTSRGSRLTLDSHPAGQADRPAVGACAQATVTSGVRPNTSREECKVPIFG